MVSYNTCLLGTEVGGAKHQKKPPAKHKEQENSTTSIPMPEGSESSATEVSTQKDQSQFLYIPAGLNYAPEPIPLLSWVFSAC